MFLIDPEYLIERVSKGKRRSCCGSLSDMAAFEAVKTGASVTAVESSVKETDGAKQLAAETILERCGECNLHNCK